MKKIILSCIFSVGSFAFAQNVSDYKYVHVPKKFNDFKQENQYNLNQHLEFKLKQKKYAIIPEEKGNWKVEPCEVLTANLKDNSNILKNRVIIELQNCNGKTVASYAAASNIKDFEEGFQDAINKAIIQLPNSEPKAIAKENKTQPNPNIEPKKHPEEKANNAEIYTLNNSDFNKISLSPQSFILVKSGTSQPYATFLESTKTGVYRVKLQNGVATLGYAEGNKLIVEIPTGNDNYQKEVFTEK